MGDGIKLTTTRHPHKEYMSRYNSLRGLDVQKQTLLNHLKLYFDESIIREWKEKHHKKDAPQLLQHLRFPPVVLLSGDVGCGKTELAQSIASPLSGLLKHKPIVVMEAPGDVRGTGRVGELSARITATFTEAKNLLKKDEYGILILDESDDLATSRSQNQAHHEDRAGVNVLIKELDKLIREKTPLAVILITNRAKALDPAVLRRAGLQLVFERPGEEALRDLFSFLLEGVKCSEEGLYRIIHFCKEQNPAYTFSDITTRVFRMAVNEAIRTDQPLSDQLILNALLMTTPTPELI